MFTRLILTLAILIFSSSLVAAQDFFGTASYSQQDTGDQILEGQLTLNGGDDDIVLLQFTNLSGEIYEDLAILQSDGQFFALMSTTDAPLMDWTALAIVSQSSGNVLGIGVVIVDTNDLGDDWTELDINDEDNWTGCEGVADDIERRLGGTFTRPTIKPKPGKGPKLGEYRDVGTGWEYHIVIVKNGRVYDGFGPRGGLTIDEYKNKWTHKDDIDFGF